MFLVSGFDFSSRGSSCFQDKEPAGCGGSVCVSPQDVSGEYQSSHDIMVKSFFTRSHPQRHRQKRLTWFWLKQRGVSRLQFRKDRHILDAERSIRAENLWSYSKTKPLVKLLYNPNSKTLILTHAWSLLRKQIFVFQVILPSVTHNLAEMCIFTVIFEFVIHLS